MKKGDKIRNQFGEIETIVTADESSVYTEEYPNKSQHPTKVWPVYYSETLKRYVTVPVS
jgi:hypothetical protein